MRPGRLAVYFIALWKTLRDPATPPHAKWLALGVLAYAVSPIDLVPDVIPLLGQLDDVVLIPLGVAAVSRLVPQAQWQARMADAERRAERLPSWRWVLAGFVLFWLVLIGLAVWAFFY